MTNHGLEVVSHDDRADDENFHFGFVYFNDDRRVAFTSEKGVVADATGGWGIVTGTHVTLATTYLKEKGIL